MPKFLVRVLKLKNGKISKDLVTLIIGVGNEYRRDDGIGLIIARKIQKLKIPNIIIKEESGEGAALIDAWQGFENVTIVDAVSSGAKPGMIFRIEANKEKLPSKFFHYSTHAFSVAESVELARALNKLPRRLVILGIEGKNFKSGTNISSAVLTAGEKVENMLCLEMSL